MGQQNAFNTTIASLNTYMSAINITGQNIANIQNPEYTRQMPVIETNVLKSGTFTQADMSMGIKLSAVRRYRSELLNGYYRAQVDTKEELQVQKDLYTKIENLFNELGDVGLMKDLGEFWSSWKALQYSPTDMNMRSYVLQVGEYVTTGIKDKYTEMGTLITDIDSELEIEVNYINKMLEELTTINPSITATKFNSSMERNANLDRKDAILDYLSGVLNIQIIKNEDESVNLYLDGTPIVVADSNRTLKLDVGAGGLYELHLNTGEDVNLRSGKLFSYFNMRDNIIPGYRTQLDDFAKALISNVNAIHNNGYTKDGSTGGDFFSGTGALNIEVTIDDPADLAIALSSLTSSTYMNTPGTEIDGSLPISGQEANFRIPPASEGQFTINGQTFNWTNLMSTSDILTQVNNNADAGVKASFNRELQKVVLERVPTSGVGPEITISDVTGNFASTTFLSSAALVKNEDGSGDNAMYIGALWYKKVIGVPPNQTINEAYQGISNVIAKDKNLVDSQYTNIERRIQTIDQERSGESGVSLDEELINIMKFQQAYTATSRLVNMIDELMDIILNMGSF